MKCLLIVFIITFITFGYGQPSKNDFVWKYDGEERRSQSLLKITEINDNAFIGVGYTNNKTEGGKDILLMKFSSDGKLLAQSQLGGRGDDVATSVATSQDGRILVCGYSYTRKEVQGFVIEVMPDMTNTLFYFDESSTNSLFNDLIIDRDGIVYVAGTSLDKAVVLSIEPTGKLIKRYTNLNEGDSKGQAICFTKDGDVFLAGSISNRKAINNSEATAIRLGKNLNQKAVYTYNQDNCFIANDILELPNGNIALMCTGVPRNRVNCPALAVISSTGEQMYGKTFPQYFNGEGIGMAMTPAGDLILTGIGINVRGADRTDAFVIRVNPDNYGEKVWKEAFYTGGPQNDACNGAYVSASGNTFLYGFRQNLLFSSDLFVYVIKPSDRDIAALNILEKVNFNDFPAISLNKNIENKILVQLKNTSQSNINKFKIKIDNIDDVDDFHVPAYVITDEMKPGETRSLIVPVRVFSTFGEKQLRLKYTVTGSSDKPYASKTVTYQTGQLFDPVIEVRTPSIAIDMSDRNKIRFQAELINSGNIDATITGFDISLSENIHFDPDFIIPTDFNLPQNKPVKVDIRLWADSLFSSESFMMAFITDDQAGLRKLTNENKPSIVRKNIPVKNFYKKPEEETIIVKSSELEINFLNVQPKFNLSDKTTYTLEFESDGDLSKLKEDLAFTINGKKVSNDNMAAGTSKGIYQLTLPLTIGMNTLAFSMPEQPSSNISEINVLREKVNYYIFAIGTDLKDEDQQPVMKYSLKDCVDFAALMKKLEQKQIIPQYESAKVNVYDTYTKTTAPSINKLFNDLRREKKKFKPNDVIIIYWVAQAFSDKDGQIWVKGSDLFASRTNKFTPQDHSIPLTKYFIPYHLNEIPCRKIVLLDIFNKTPKGDEEEESTNDLIDKTIAAIKTHDKFDFILAGDIGQQSYELEKVNNGAFTSAVISAITDEKNADRNRDGNIDLAELFENISVSVPELVKNHRQEKTWIQTPRRIRSDDLDDIIVYFRNK